jgi:hypothetical protein
VLYRLSYSGDGPILGRPALPGPWVLRTFQAWVVKQTRVQRVTDRAGGEIRRRNVGCCGRTDSVQFTGPWEDGRIDPRDLPAFIDAVRLWCSRYEGMEDTASAPCAWGLR